MHLTGCPGTALANKSKYNLQELRDALFATLTSQPGPRQDTPQVMHNVRRPEEEAVWSRFAFRLMLFAGIWALACAPAILLAESKRWPQWPFHSTQLVACLVCIGGSTWFLVATRSQEKGWRQVVALAGWMLAGAWVFFVAWVLLTLDFSGMS